MGKFNWKNAMWGGLGAGALGWLSSKKGDDSQSGFISPPAYEGQRPFSEEEVRKHAFLGPIYTGYGAELQRKAQGQGLVGFDPQWYETKKAQGMKSLGEAYTEGQRVRSAQASGQGLRGGIPMEIERQAMEDYGDTSGKFISDLSISDLEARREDTNKAFYEQPNLVNLGAGIQQNRANFDLSEYGAEMPTYMYEEPQENTLLPALLSAAGTIGGAYFGGPAGAGVGASVGNAAGQAISPNRSMRSPYSSQMNLRKSPVYTSRMLRASF